ncbi:hypothetical protein X566_12235 [Afipia sp. P52-10]|nr:hypothetical protein X566_12235 [Afipia sp. P52-10]
MSFRSIETGHCRLGAGPDDANLQTTGLIALPTLPRVI